MDDSDLLDFAPVQLRSRSDGWTAKKQYFFILGLARGFSVGKAAGILGMTRKTAYELRRRPGAEGFARAWDRAAGRARERRFAGRPPSLAERALHGEWHPRLDRGRLVGWVHKPATRRALGLLKRLDRQAERLQQGAEPADVARFLGAEPPERDGSAEISRFGRHDCHVPGAHASLGKRRG